MRALVTGTCGFVGRHLARFLEESGDEVVGTYLREPPEIAGVTEQLDITDLAACTELIEKHKPDVVYHLAGMSFVPEAEKNFQRALDINVGGTHNIFDACASLRSAVTVIYVSSSQVYGKLLPSELPVTEDAPIRPVNAYSLSKSMAEMAIARFAEKEHITAVVMRPFNHIGPGQDDRFVSSSFARQLASIAAGKTKPEIRVGNLEAKREFIDVRDVTRAYRLAAENGKGVYNVASGEGRPVQQLLDLLIEISGLQVEVVQDPERMRPSDVPEIRGSFDKIHKELGWSPQIDFRDSLRDIYDYWLQIEQSG